MLDTVVSILRSKHDWPLDCSPAPKATARALETQTPEEVAQTLDSFCWNQAAGLPDPNGYPNGAYILIRYRYFATGREMWESNTRIALGQDVEVPVAHGPEAHSVSDWWANQEANLNYLGYGLISLDDPNGVKEREGRWRAAREENIPPEWRLNGLGVVYQLLTREGLNTEWRGFGYFGSERKAWDDYRNFLGLSAQQVLDNLWAAHRLTDPRVKWLPGGALVPGWED